MPDFDLTFTLNGQTIQARKGESILGAALRSGVHIPHFCYHKNLSVVGQCRACLVDVTNAGNGNPIPKLQPSCAMPVADGMVVESESERVKDAQESVFEFLLKNHPLDCPVCDQGGECPLQDQTMAYGKAISRTHELRRLYPRKELSPYIKPEMNRCVHCTRCIRFTSEIDGGGEFGWAHRGDRTEVGVFEDLPVTSIVSGNVIDICPVGALTDNKYRFTARVWEMKNTEGPCTLCSVGCRQEVWTMFDEIKRVTAGENEEVNDTWICDVARWGWSGVHHNDKRILKPMIRKDGALQPATWGEAIGLIAEKFETIREKSGGGALAGIGGARATNESAYQFGVFMRNVLGSGHLDCRIHPRDANQTEAQRESFGVVGGLGSIEGIGRARAVLLVGSDPFEEHPILALQARKAHRAGAQVVNVHPRRIDLRVYGGIHHLTPVPGEEARALRALAKSLAQSGASPEGDGAEVYQGSLERTDAEILCREAGVHSKDVSAAAKALLPDEERSAVIVGPGLRDKGAIAEAINIALLLNANLVFAPEAANLQGALDMGVHPADAGEGTGGILQAASEGKIRGMYLFDCDPAAEHPDGDLARKALEGVEFTVLHASHANASMEYADVVLPALTLYEEEGTVTNLERRVQRLRRAVKPVAGRDAKEGWRIFCDISRVMEHPIMAHALNTVQAEARKAAPDYAKAFGRMPEESLRLVREAKGAYRTVALPPSAAASGGLRLILAPALWLSGAYAASAYHLSNKPAAALRLSPPDAERIGVADGEEVEVNLAGKTVRLPAQVDATLPVGLALAPEGYLGALGGASLNQGGDSGARGAAIRVARASEAVSA